MAVIFLIFWGAYLLFSIVANQFKFPSTGHKGSPLFTSSPVLQLLSRVRLFATPPTAARRLPWPSPALGACPSSQCAVPFSSRLQSFPASGSFPVSQFFTSGGQSIGHHQRLFVVFLMIAILTSVRWHLTVILSCFSLEIWRCWVGCLRSCKKVGFERMSFLLEPETMTALWVSACFWQSIK